jgi:hypothetical protein
LLPAAIISIAAGQLRFDFWRIGADMNSVTSAFSGFSAPSTLASLPRPIGPVVAFLALAFWAPAQGQESKGTTESVAEAARAARERKANATKHPKVITNDDLRQEPQEPSAPGFRLRLSVPKEPTFPLQPSVIYAAQAAEDANQLANLPVGGCDNPRAERIRLELREAWQELDEVRRELSYQPVVISDNDLDLQYFRPGHSGLYLGAPPMLETEPPAPARVFEVELEERITSLEKELRMACEPPEAARIQREIDLAERDLDLLRRQFALDQDAYYSETNFWEDKGGQAQLDAEWQEIDYMQWKIQRLKDELAQLEPYGKS